MWYFFLGSFCSRYRYIFSLFFRSFTLKGWFPSKLGWAILYWNSPRFRGACTDPLGGLGAVRAREASSPTSRYSSIVTRADLSTTHTRVIPHIASCKERRPHTSLNEVLLGTQKLFFCVSICVKVNASRVKKDIGTHEEHRNSWRASDLTIGMKA